MFDLRKLTKTLLGILGLVVVAWAVETALTVWAWRSRNPRALHLIKHRSVRILRQETARVANGIVSQIKVFQRDVRLVRT